MTTPKEAPPKEGEIIAGKYRVEKKIGEGGMGLVLAAIHIDLQEVRAIKLMRGEALENRQAVERFLREARAAVRLRGEHVAAVYDVGRLESGAPYIVMEYLRGYDLSVITKRMQQLPVDVAVAYILQACSALTEAHAAGIIHRDLKPGNLFVTTRADGSPCLKVLDFGVSKQLHQGVSADPLIEMTGTADILGTPAYMSPEQMRSSRYVDARTDIWALGAILYRLLTGRPPFPGPSTLEVVGQVLDSSAPTLPSVWRPDLPKGLEAVIMRCLEKNLMARMPTVRDLISALRAFEPSGPGASSSRGSDEDSELDKQGSVRSQDSMSTRPWKPAMRALPALPQPPVVEVEKALEPLAPAVELAAAVKVSRTIPITAHGVAVVRAGTEQPPGMQPGGSPGLQGVSLGIGAISGDTTGASVAGWGHSGPRSSSGGNRYRLVFAACFAMSGVVLAVICWGWLVWQNPAIAARSPATAETSPAASVIAPAVSPPLPEPMGAIPSDKLAPAVPSDRSGDHAATAAGGPLETRAQKPVHASAAPGSKDAARGKSMGNSEVTPSAKTPGPSDDPFHNVRK